MNPVTQTVDKAILDIQILASDLDQTNTDKLESDLWNLESMASALRSFILNQRCPDGVGQDGLWDDRLIIATITGGSYGINPY